MSLHKITAGSGYEYLTRQVARHDSTEDARPSLASYYTDKGETPGRWVGAGMAGLDGLEAGDLVTAEQMRSLFGAGYHPLAADIAATFQGAGHTQAAYEAAIALGKPFTVYADDVSPFRVEVAQRFDAYNRGRGVRGDAPIPLDVRATIRSDIARARFRAEYGRSPLDAREFSGYLARLSRQHTTAVAGFDLTFSPVKSVSTLWAVADLPTAALVERAHHAAVADALGFLEAHALYSRLGSGGVRQVDVRGLIGAAFTHRDSRAGDPDLHTHVAVANKVQTVDGRWLAIDGRVLYKANVAASEVYNTHLERHLTEALGVRFTERPATGTGRRPIRELDGIHPHLLQRWSTRRQTIEVRRSVLAQEFQARHGRPPTPIEQIGLAQQATLDTRDAKHAPRSLTEQRADWRTQALQVCGGTVGLERMIGRILHPQAGWRPAGADAVADPAWMEATAAAIVATVEGHRSTWQTWHLRAEAYRQARTATLTSDAVEHVVDVLVVQAIGAHSVPVTHPTNDPISEPRVLRRRDGTSVYSVAGAPQFTSRRILDAEQRLVALAGRRDGHAATDVAVDLALLETAANGFELNPGQAALARQMATSGVRLQVAIAPAGSGKTTAMATLARAWIEDGGTIIGLAPSAAAAEQLGSQIGHHTDTLAKLVWHLDHTPVPVWMSHIGAHSLVVIDEAGMADTLTLDRAVGWLINQGASVRLIGDDQQLAAIGSGGVLRDIEAVHGVLRLRDLVRFADPAEAAASLALREGRPEAIGFYLDQRRVHVGDQTTLCDDLFNAWAADRADGADSIMLAPTRALVATLNERARSHRLNGAQPGREVTLADDNQASIGDIIITRHNDRRLQISPTAWVKNGDRWTIETLHPDGALRARHLRTGLVATLPADYVTAAVELGYASTIHTAQGISVDTVHGLAGPDLARQPLYTMLTRGRHANHLYLEVVGDGSEHTVIRPETINPNTPTDLIEAILARDDSPTSATSQQRLADAPAPRLYAAAHRYADALGVAADTIAGPDAIATLEQHIEAVLPDLTRTPDWPALRTQLLILDANDRNPVTALMDAAAERPIRDADDPAAVLAWRLDAHLTGGPLPWLARIPTALADHPDWGPYLTRRAHLVTDLAGQVADAAQTDAGRPGWLIGTSGTPTAGLLADIAVWRAATGVEDTDLRPTGGPQPSASANRWQQHLNRRLTAHHNPAVAEWAPLLRHLSPLVDHDPYTTTLARQLAQLAGAGINAHHLATVCAAEGPLPDDHTAAALWWRIQRHLTPDTTRGLDADTRIPDGWADQISDHIGVPLADQLQASPYWTALSAAIENGLQRGWTLPTLLTDAHPDVADGSIDAAQALAWRIALATDPHGYGDDAPADPSWDAPPADLHDGYHPTDPHHALSPTSGDQPADPDVLGAVGSDNGDDPQADLDLRVEAIIRNGLRAPEPTAIQIREALDRRDAWNQATTTPERLTHINQLTADYYTRRFTDSWARPYLTGRFGVDLTGHPAYQPGYAPAGWTHLIDHLRTLGVHDDEQLAAGVATQASTGRLIDRFRDRATFPITSPDGHILGFVGRANPTTADPTTPKYLNTADTLLFGKGRQLFAPAPVAGATAVLVEGPMDAVAVTLASGGRYVGVAPLGTSLTDDQAAQLAAWGPRPIIATDPDQAGRAAAERDYWQLAPHQTDPRYAVLPNGHDPADLLATGQAAALVSALDRARPLAHELLARRLGGLPHAVALTPALQVIAAQPADQWDISEAAITGALNAPTTLVRLGLKEQINAFNNDPRAFAQAAHDEIHTLTDRHAVDQHQTGTPPEPSQTPEPTDPTTTSADRKDEPTAQAGTPTNPGHEPTSPTGTQTTPTQNPTAPLSNPGTRRRPRDPAPTPQSPNRGVRR